MSNLARKLGRARGRARFLDQVRRLDRSPQELTMVLLKRPPNRAALKGYLEFQKELTIRLEDPRLEAPLENLPALYQLWCTFGVIDRVLEQAKELGYHVGEQSLFRRDELGLYLELALGGRAAVDLYHPEYGNRVRIIPERTYGETGSLRSVSYRQRPDLAIEHWRPDGAVVVLILDPKYKLEETTAEDVEGRPKKADIDKMHTYRDAIVDIGGRRIVQGAWILYPGGAWHPDPGVGGIRAVPGEGLSMQEALRLAEFLRPGL